MPALTDGAALRDLVARYTPILQLIPEDKFGFKSDNGKWSKKEILGHLIDSAQNNLRRFITAQYEVQPPHIVYDQDFWVSANRYQFASSRDLILLWKLLNEQLATILENIPPERMNSQCNTGKGKDEFHPLTFLAADYVSHADHHLQQISN